MNNDANDNPDGSADEPADERMDIEESALLTADGFEDALIGIGTRFRHDVAIYSYEKCLQILMQRDGMSYETAEEYMDFNVTGAYVGENTPVYLRFRTLEEWEETQYPDGDES